MNARLANGEAGCCCFMRFSDLLNGAALNTDYNHRVRVLICSLLYYLLNDIAR